MCGTEGIENCPIRDPWWVAIIVEPSTVNISRWLGKDIKEENIDNCGVIWEDAPESNIHSSLGILVDVRITKRVSPSDVIPTWIAITFKS